MCLCLFVSLFEILLESDGVDDGDTSGGAFVFVADEVDAIAIADAVFAVVVV